MRKLAAFMTVTLNGFFSGADGDKRRAHAQDEAFKSFLAATASDGGVVALSLRRRRLIPDIAKGMSSMHKWVALRTPKAAGACNSQVRCIFNLPGPDLPILRGGSEKQADCEV